MADLKVREILTAMDRPVDAEQVLGQNIKAGLAWLQTLEHDAERKLVIEWRPPDRHPTDMLAQVGRYVRQTTGSIQGSSAVTVEVAPGRYEECFWNINLPSMEAVFKVTPDGASFTTVQRRRAEARVWLAGLSEYVTSHSIYMGRAIHDDFSWVTPAPHLSSDAMVLPDSLRTELQAFVWTPIERWAETVAAGLPRKRGVVLAGAYGSGKSLAAMETARCAYRNGVTFVAVKQEHVDRLAATVEAMLPYAPLVLFVEDVDTQTQGDRGQLNSLLDILDGIISKHQNILFLVTTNHPELIHPAFLRPGRLDAIITFGAPDYDTIRELLYSQLSRELPLDYDRAARKLSGLMPAMIVGVGHRAKLLAWAAGRHEPNDSDLNLAVDGVVRHAALASREDKAVAPTIDSLVAGVVERAVVKAAATL